MRHRIKVICLMAILCQADRILGELIVVDDPRYGPSSIVRDTATGLDWLNLQVTANLSYDTVVGNFGPGGQFQGFRYADLDDIGTFFADAQIPDIDQESAANAQPVRNLLFEIGILHGGDPCFCAFSFGINSESLAPGTHNESELLWQAFPQPGEGEAIRETVDQQADSSPGYNPFVGSFVIRQSPVPEPRPIALLSAVALGALCYRRYSAKLATVAD